LSGGGNTPAVVVDTTPGAIWRYSGGGYTVAQVLLSDISGTPFATLMQQRVLGPMHMTLSTYQQPLPQARWNEAATGYRANGNPVEESWHVYPEQAAAGLWTTPDDLARWGLAILAAYRRASGGVLSPGMAKQMLTPTLGNYGLGPAISPDGKSFGHGGSNEGFRCQVTVFFDGRGAAVMTNSDLGGSLIQEIMTTLSTTYAWPALGPAERPVVTLPAATLGEIAGVYHFPGDTNSAVVTLESGRLFLSHPALGRVELLPQSDSRLFSRDDGTDFTVVRDNARIVALEVFGQRVERKRRP
jgi:CubicO group peptidase (beta-lactamase class C family)